MEFLIQLKGNYIYVGLPTFFRFSTVLEDIMHVKMRGHVGFALFLTPQSLMKYLASYGVKVPRNTWYMDKRAG